MLAIKSYIILSVTCLLLVSGIYAQETDYKIIRKSITRLSCKPFDSIGVSTALMQLKGIDTTKISLNIDLYYHDMGWSYYRVYLHSKKTEHLVLAIQNFKKQKEQLRDFWNIAFCYYLLEECDNAEFYLKKYLSNTPKEYLKSDEEIAKIRRNCR